MTIIGDVDARNRLCRERLKIEAEQLPYAHTVERRKTLLQRLEEIEAEIRLTYEVEPGCDRPAGQ